MPNKDLTSYVQYFAVLDNRHSVNHKQTFKVLADGCPGLIIQENPHGILYQRERLPQAFLHGLATTYADKTISGSIHNICVCFYPGALKKIFGINASELTNRFVDLSLLVKNDLVEQIINQKIVDDKIDLLSDFIMRQLRKNQSVENIKLNYAVEKIKIQEHGFSLTTIQQELNLSERSFERLFNANVGVSPKLFFRINRFQKALNQLRTSRFESFSELAYRYSYADQSHYVREFNEFSGTTPKQFVLHVDEQLTNFPEWKR